MALRDKIRGLPRRTVEVLGETVEVRGLSAAASVALEDAVPHGPGGERDRADLLVRYVVACTFEADGAPAFTEADIGWLKADADGAALKALFVAAGELNGLLGGPEKNSPPPAPAASPTASP